MGIISLMLVFLTLWTTPCLGQPPSDDDTRGQEEDYYDEISNEIEELRSEINQTNRGDIPANVAFGDDGQPLYGDEDNTTSVNKGFTLSDSKDLPEEDHLESSRLGESGVEVGARNFSYGNKPERPAITDIFCWMGNSRISQTCSLERCDFWITYNSTKAPRGFACVRADYTLDGQEHVYRNCANTVSSKYDPCEAMILGADNPRVNLTSCEVCWDNGCNIHGYRNIWYKSKNDTTVQESVNKVRVYNFVHLTSWTWFLLFVLGLALLLCCLAVVMRLMCCTCPKNFQSCTSSHMHEGESDTSYYEGHPDMAMDA